MSFSSVAARANVGTAKASPVSTPTGTASRTHHEANAPNSAATPTKIVRRDDEVERDDGEVPAEDLGDAQRRGEHRGVHLVPPDVAEDGVGRLAEGQPHRLHGDDARHDELEVGDAVDAAGAVVDQGAEAQAHRQQEEQRRQEAADDRPLPGAPVDEQVVGHDGAQPLGLARGPARPGAQAAAGGRRA